MIWAQIFPFVALQFFDNDDVKGIITLMLFGLSSLWLVMNIIFFKTINRKYIRTFFTRKTSAEYTCERFLDAKDDRTR